MGFEGLNRARERTEERNLLLGDDGELADIYTGDELDLPREYTPTPQSGREKESKKSKPKRSEQPRDLNFFYRKFIRLPLLNFRLTGILRRVDIIGDDITSPPKNPDLDKFFLQFVDISDSTNFWLLLSILKSNLNRMTDQGGKKEYLMIYFFREVLPRIVENIKNSISSTDNQLYNLLTHRLLYLLSEIFLEHSSSSSSDSVIYSYFFTYSSSFLFEMLGSEFALDFVQHFADLFISHPVVRSSNSYRSNLTYFLRGSIVECIRKLDQSDNLQVSIVINIVNLLYEEFGTYTYVCDIIDDLMIALGSKLHLSNDDHLEFLYYLENLEDKNISFRFLLKIFIGIAQNSNQSDSDVNKILTYLNGIQNRNPQLWFTILTIFLPIFIGRPEKDLSIFVSIYQNLLDVISNQQQILGSNENQTRFVLLYFQLRNFLLPDQNSDSSDSDNNINTALLKKHSDLINLIIGGSRSEVYIKAFRIFVVDFVTATEFNLGRYEEDIMDIIKSFFVASTARLTERTGTEQDKIRNELVLLFSVICEKIKHNKEELNKMFGLLENILDEYVLSNNPVIDDQTRLSCFNLFCLLLATILETRYLYINHYIASKVVSILNKIVKVEQGRLVLVNDNIPISLDTPEFTSLMEVINNIRSNLVRLVRGMSEDRTPEEERLKRQQTDLLRALDRLNEILT